MVLGPITGNVSLDSAQASVFGGTAGDAVGTRVSAAGDLDGDGSGDVLISAPGSDAAAAGGGAVGLILGGGL